VTIELFFSATFVSQDLRHLLLRWPRLPINSVKTREFAANYPDCSDLGGFPFENPITPESFKKFVFKMRFLC